MDGRSEEREKESGRRESHSLATAQSALYPPLGLLRVIRGRERERNGDCER